MELQLQKLTMLQDHINLLETTDIISSIEVFFSMLDKKIELNNYDSNKILTSWNKLFSGPANAKFNKQAIEKIVYQLLWHMSSWIKKKTIYEN